MKIIPTPTLYYVVKDFLTRVQYMLKHTLAQALQYNANVLKQNPIGLVFILVPNLRNYRYRCIILILFQNYQSLGVYGTHYCSFAKCLHLEPASRSSMKNILYRAFKCFNKLTLYLYIAFIFQNKENFKLQSWVSH